MRQISILLLSLLFACTAFANRGVGITEKSNRIALIIGNANYQSAPLRNPVNDANDMASVLKEKGFVVTLLTDASKRQMKGAINDFGKQLRDGGVGLFFYAGHGMQAKGLNYAVARLIKDAAELGKKEIEKDKSEESRILKQSRIISKIGHCEYVLPKIHILSIWSF